MGERFYLQQLDAIGTCPGKPKNKRRKRVAWDDEKKAQVVAAYQAGEPTPENTMELIKEIAEEYEESVNGVRMVLVKEGVYVKKDGSSSSSNSSEKEGKSKRVSKNDAIAGLVEALNSVDAEVNEDIVNKLTGKAAVYFTVVINSLK